MKNIKQGVVHAALAPVWDLSDNFWMWDFKELAVEAGLAESTVRRLWHEQTQEPRWSTVKKLTDAVGLNYKEILPARSRAKRIA